MRIRMRCHSITEVGGKYLVNLEADIPEKSTDRRWDGSVGHAVARWWEPKDPTGEFEVGRKYEIEIIPTAAAAPRAPIRGGRGFWSTLRAANDLPEGDVATREVHGPATMVHLRGDGDDAFEVLFVATPTRPSGDAYRTSRGFRVEITPVDE